MLHPTQGAYLCDMKRQKYGGRTKGTPNSITRDLRHLIFETISKHLDKDLSSLDASKRAELLIRCLPYVMPTAIDYPIADDVEPLTLVLTRESCARCEPNSSKID
jgi:hypothetical protein